MVKRIVLLLLVYVAFGANARSQQIVLSPAAEISVMTCGASDLIHAIYGHTAIRVNDPAQHWDVVFNYGVFSFSQPNFVYRFATGKTDYMLAPERYSSFYNGYVRNGRSIEEQVLNLTPAEKQEMLDFLMDNARPENREYRYNFFHDNCATRVRDAVDRELKGQLEWDQQSEHKTFRQHVTEYQKILPWTNFGIQLVLGSPSDKTASAWEEMFLPAYLYQHFAKAQRLSPSGKAQPLVKHTNLVFEAPTATASWLVIHSPELILLAILLLIFFISYQQLRKGEISYTLDYLLLIVNGLVGLILLWFFLYSEHPAMRANYNQLWAIWLNLPFAFLWMVKKWRPLLRWYWVALSAWLILFIPASLFIPQEFFPGFYMLIAMLLCRSLLHSRFVLRS